MERTEKNVKYDLPFDQYSRQQIAADIVNTLRNESSVKLKVLDIGGYKGKTREFLSSDTVTVVDLFDVKEEGYVRASGLDLPFKDGEFDFCVSFDVLEHVSDKDRQAFVNEALRVASRGFILCAPHLTRANQAAETLLNKYYKKIHGTSHRWLHEHIDEGLPDINKLLSKLDKNTYKIVMLHSNDTFLWTLMQGALFLNEKYPQGAKSLIALNKYINNELTYTRGSKEEDSYRQINAIFKNQHDADAIQKSIKITELDELGKQDFLERIQEYYLGLARGLSDEIRYYQNEAENYKKERDGYKREVDAIKNSKIWRVARRAAKVAGIRK